MGLFQGNFYAHSLKLTTRLQIILPEPSNDVTPIFSGTPKVLYLLHGLGGNCEEWTRFSKIEYYAKKYNFIIIMPEVQRSFYCDTAYGHNYFTYVADELPSICARWFRINSARENTFIAGESMGGYGAVKVGLSRPRRYCAIASLSGVLDDVSMCQKIACGEWSEMAYQELEEIFGPGKLPNGSNGLLELLRRTAQDPCRPKLLQLCGTEDFLYEENQAFRNTAEQAGYGHTYVEAPGGHEWPYWDKAIQRAFQFFCGSDLEQTQLY